MFYLLDTCAYLRLALNIHPLLGDNYYAPPTVAQVTSDVNSEWEQSSRLKNKFYWAGEPRFVENRLTNLVKLAGSQATDIWRNRQFIRSHAQMVASKIKKAGCTIPSPADCAVLAYTFTLNEHNVAVTTVSDDGGLCLIGNELQIPVISSVHLVHEMFKANKRTTDQVKSLAAYLDYEKDLPGDWRQLGNSLFGVALP